MFQLSLPWWELLLRGAAVYLMVLLLLRLAGKRQVGDLTPFDFTLLLLISEGASTCVPVPTNGVCPTGYHLDPSSEGSRCI